MSQIHINPSQHKISGVMNHFSGVFPTVWVDSSSLIKNKDSRTTDMPIEWDIVKYFEEQKGVFLCGLWMVKRKTARLCFQESFYYNILLRWEWKYSYSRLTQPNTIERASLIMQPPFACLFLVFSWAMAINCPQSRKPFFLID